MARDAVDAAFEKARGGESSENAGDRTCESENEAAADDEADDLASARAENHPDSSTKERAGRHGVNPLGAVDELGHSQVDRN